MRSSIALIRIDKQINNLAWPEGTVVDGGRGGELFHLRDANGVEKLQDVGLAVVADEIVAGRALRICCITASPRCRVVSIVRVCVPFLATLTRSPQLIVVEASFANRESLPSVPISAVFTTPCMQPNSLFSFDPRIDVNVSRV